MVFVHIESSESSTRNWKSSVSSPRSIPGPRAPRPQRWEGKMGEHEDWRSSDQYATGITIFELLSRGESFPLNLGDGSITSCCHAHLTGAVKPLQIHEYPGRRFSSIDTVIERMLQKGESDAILI